MFHLFWLWPLWFWAPFHGLCTLLIVVLLISLVSRRRHYYYYGHPWGWSGTSRSQALDVLEGRYARGEIQRDEYLQKKQDLGG